MIFVGTKLMSADNSGAKLIKCIKVLGAAPKTAAFLGRIILVVIQVLSNTKKLLKKKMYFGLIISIKFKTKRIDGTFFKNDNNRILLLTESYRFIGTRIYGPICKEIRATTELKIRYKKIISYSALTI
jgi:large subunit ribosomal protein L14